MGSHSAVTSHRSYGSLEKKAERARERETGIGREPVPEENDKDERNSHSRPETAKEKWVFYLSGVGQAETKLLTELS